MSSIISVKGLTKTYGGKSAISELNFNVSRGEVVGFVGLNGAGKSTTINILLGFLNATHGQVSLFGQPVTPANAHVGHKSVGFASGDMSLFGNLKGGQYFDFVASVHGNSDHTKLKYLLNLFKPEMDKKISNLSRGNKQKIALIAAFMNSPELIILDEPSSGLDPLMQQIFIDLVREESSKGTTIFMSSHYLNEVTDVSTRILLIKDGKITKDMPISQLAGSGDKLVKIDSKTSLKLPVGSKLLAKDQFKHRVVTTFSYSGDLKKLAVWLSKQKDLNDFSVAQHNQEDAFEDLYSLESEGGVNV